ncbi:integrin alpha-PS3 [Nasonia vitripennis]|uniref:Uncharacterized protein n=1 Tax=Nasonia vitripennis TaxID=7425 RepID=A0A7M7QHK5_NASVI|nr:integrin alpha-PS3 [Nasonia vitripennis]
MLFLLALLSTLHLHHHQALGYNVDDKHPKIFSSEAAAGESYFGYSVALYAGGEDSVLLVGAPRANSSFFPGVFEPGAVYRCSPANGSCSEWLIDVSGERQVKDGSWLGASMDLRVPREDESTEARVAICAPRWKKETLYAPKRSYMNGMCFSSTMFVEEIFLAYFKELAMTLSPPILWNRYSMLKTTVKTFDHIFANLKIIHF